MSKLRLNCLSISAKCSQGPKSNSLTGCQRAMVEAKQRNPYSLNDETEILDLSLKHF